MRRFPFNIPALLQLLIPVILIPPLTGWLGDILKDWFTKGIEQGEWALGKADSWLLCIGSLLMLVLFFIMNRASKKLTPPSIVAQHQGDQVEAHPVLISLLSLQGGLESGEDGWSVKGTKLPDTLDAACKRTLEISGFSWQQNLRAARHHYSKGLLKKLIVIGSSGEKGSGSKESLELAKRFFAHYLPGVEILAPGLDNPTVFSPDFENLEATRHALNKAISLSQAPDKDIIIDITGGQKTASVAATLVTLDRADLMFQYMGTSDQTGVPFGFNAITETSQG